ncbi:conserved hypothetical protein [Sporisorium reilianum SRZ2]|uniref:Zn(2)-C6 fungal-type domain-containing protein n=1 Tax=Sporisorium reilianum (strain SRZ2) TaxID=999809 RepID=E6ZYF6_SPORE|nr:conserved hypothetical protein [Sporisorium reilianum SRZ2]
MRQALGGASPSSTTARKRPLAKRSCLKCREKKTRCELPDIFVDSSKSPLPSDKCCHRCKALDIECIVWDGDRKRKPKLDLSHESSTPRASAERRAASSSSQSPAKVVEGTSEADSRNFGAGAAARSEATNATGHRRNDSNSSRDSTHNADAEQLAASDLSHAQHLLISRQKIWKAMSRTLHALIERLNRERRYSSYLQLRIDAPPSTPDMATFLSPARALQLDAQLQDYLVGHPYLPSLSTLQRKQAQSPTRPRALLIATVTLLGLKSTEDELYSSDVRTLSSYVDRLGTQLLFSSPRDIHLVMALELLLAHEPGLVGTAASQFELEGRGFGLASEALLTCAIKVAKELKLDEGLALARHTPASLAHLSLWCCLKTWDAVYAFLDEKVMILQDLHDDFAAGVRRALFCVDDDGHSLPPPPRLEDANGSTAHSFQEMRTFCAEAERKLGRDGILRSAGRTVLSIRIQAACRVFDSLRKLQETLSDADLTLEQRHERISNITTQAYDGILALRNDSFEDLGFYAGQRLVRLWEQLLHIECAFFCGLYGSYATSALFSGKIDGAVDPQDLTRSIRFRLGPAERIAEVDRFGLEVSRTLLATVAQMDRQPALRGQGRRPGSSSSRYLCRLPTLLVCAMTVHAARRCLESVAFVLVAWAHNSTDALSAATLMEAAAQQVRHLAPTSSNENAYTIARVSADYIDEMVETSRLWQVYYRVYRPVSSVKLNQASGAAAAGNDVNPRRGQDSNGEEAAVSPRPSAPSQATAMDFLASAAEAAQVSGSRPGLADGPLPAPRQGGTGETCVDSSTAQQVVAAGPPLPWNAQAPGFQQPTSTTSGTQLSSHAQLVDADFYNACLPFDLEAFLEDVDQLF